MNQYQSVLYQLTESVGAVSMVNVEQIKREENLDYLEHLCTFIDRMNINPIWFENEDQNNKLKILQIYQLAINYSTNLSTAYQQTIIEKEAEVKALREAEKKKTREIRDHKDDYQIMKEKYKLKKHQIYKFMYDNLRNKVREEDSYRDTRRDHHDPRAELPPEIVYYYPQQNDPMRYDPNFHPYPSYANMPPQPPQHAPYDPRMFSPHEAHPYPQPTYFPNPNHQPHQDPFLAPLLSHASRPTQAETNAAPTDNYLQFLNGNQMQQPQQQPKPEMPITNSKIVSPTHNQPETPKSIDMEKSKIIASGEKFFEKISQEIKEKSEKSISKESGAKKRQSVPNESRQDEDDDFGNLTANSKRKENSIKMSKKDSSHSLEQEQFDSIAHIQLVSQSSAKSIGQDPKPNRFQSKIYGNQEKPVRPPTASQPDPPSRITEVPAQGNSSVNDIDNISSIMQSKFSKNAGKQLEGERMHTNLPKRNTQPIRQSALKSTIGEEPKEQEDAHKPTENRKPTGAQAPPKPIDESIDIFKSNGGRKESNKIEKPKGGESVDIYSSNMGQGSNNSKASEGERMFSGKLKPKRSGQSETPSPTLPPAQSPSPHLEVPDVKKSHTNQLRISIAESQEMRGSNMAYSQAQSINFNKEPAKTPPKLEKEQAEEEDDAYEDDFDIDEIDLLDKSHLPVSHNKVTAKAPEKSEVNIHISAIPTAKEIVRDKFAKLPNEVFQLKATGSQSPKNVAASSNLAEEDSFFDQILEMPMNSRIAQRPSIHKFEPPSIQNFAVQSVESLKKIIDSGRIPSNIIRQESSGTESVQKLKESDRIGSFGSVRSPSIHVIDPTGVNERLQERGGSKRERTQQAQAEQPATQNAPLFANFANQNDRINTSRSSNNMRDFLGDSKLIDGQQTSLLNPSLPPSKPEIPKTESEDDELDLELMEKSSVDPTKSKKQEKQKLITQIRKLQEQSPTFKDAKGFDEGWFDKILKDQFKCKSNDIKSAEKWDDIGRFYREQYEAMKEREKEERPKQEKYENASTPKGQRDSNYDDLQYSQSNVKIENKSKTETRKSSFDPVKEMTESITIKDQPKVQQRATPKNVENKYSRSGKQKADIKGELTKNINLGKNAYDVDDPLNVTAIQNKKLLEEQEDSEFDF